MLNKTKKNNKIKKKSNFKYFLLILISLLSAIVFGVIDAVFFFIAEKDLQSKIEQIKNINRPAAELLTGGISASVAILFASLIKKILSQYFEVIENPIIDSIGVLLGTLIIFVIYILIRHFRKEESFRLFYESSPSTRNMSYDLRCEPIIPKKNYGIMDSSIQPHHRMKCLEMR